MFNYFNEHNTGRDEDLIELEKYAEHNAPYQDLIYSIITKDLKVGISSVTLNKVYGDGFIPKFDVMLAYKYFDDPEKYVPEGTEFLLTTKLDGVRCICINEDGNPKFFSRQGQLIEGLDEIFYEIRALPDGHVYDGELLLNKPGLESKDLYRETVKVTGSDGVKKNLIFNIFDILRVDDFKHKNAFKTLKNVDVLYDGTDKSQIEYWLNKITSEGGEGVMINIADAPYECKRTKNLLKVKKFLSADVRVIGLEEGTGQNTGKLGAINVEFIGPDNNIKINY